MVEILPECQFPRFSKIPLKGGREKRRNGAQPQNGILRKGVWGQEPPTSKNGLPAVTLEVRFEYLWEQIHCLPSSAFSKKHTSG